MYEVDYAKILYFGKYKTTVRQRLLHLPSVWTESDLRTACKMRLTLWRKQPSWRKH